MQVNESEKGLEAKDHQVCYRGQHARQSMQMAMTPFDMLFSGRETLSPTSIPFHAKRGSSVLRCSGTSLNPCPCSREPGSFGNWNGTRRAVPLLM